jgi:hypothetical protein
MKDYLFSVECHEAGQRRSYSDSYYSYTVKSELAEHTVRQFCMNVLRKSYEPKDMPHPFAGRLLEFKLTAPNTYSYKTEEMYTG